MKRIFCTILAVMMALGVCGMNFSFAEEASDEKLALVYQDKLYVEMTFDEAVENNIIDKSGSWFAYNGSKIAQGRDAAKQYLIDHPDIKEEIEEKIRDSYMPADDEDSEAVVPGEVDVNSSEDDDSDDDILGIDV